MNNAVTIVLGILVLLVIFIAFPYLTYLAFTCLVHATSFGISEWAAALWLMMAFGAVGAASSR